MAPVDVGPGGPDGAAAGPVGRGGVRLGGARPRGRRVVNEPGALCWNDLMTRDVAKAVAFYGDTFGWEWRARGRAG